MAAFDELRQCLPHAPLYRFDWKALGRTALAPLFAQMAKTPQHAAWHGEGDVWAHTKLVCEELAALERFRAMEMKKQEAAALAALLHDVGKIRCTRMEDGVLVSPGHAAAGEQMARSLLWREYGLCGSAERQQLRETVCLLIRFHTLPLHLFENEDAVRRARTVAACAQQTPDFSLDLLCLLAEADVRGRICADRQQLLEAIELGRMLCAEAGCLSGPFPFASPHTQRAYLSGRRVYEQQALFDDTWGEVILLCGLPGTGKDTWINTHYRETPAVSLDDLRREMRVRPTDDQGAVVQAAREKARVFLRAKRPFIWNATSLTPMLREKNIRLFEDYGASVRIVYLETAWAENLSRNQNREHTVPESVIGGMLDKLEPPRAGEARHVQWICL